MELVPEVFYTICKHFFLEDGRKKEFSLPSREDTTSDPFVKYLDEKTLTGSKIKRVIAPPSISPDLAFFSHSKKNKNVFGLEVKTTKSTTSGINFNSTPPCGQIVVDIDGTPSTIPCFYLIVQLVDSESGLLEIGSLTMIHGDFINSDFELYKQAVGIREKKIDIGSYGDGMDRQRPMFVFPNPLNIAGIRGERSTLISKEQYKFDKLGKVAELNRLNGEKFFAYQTVRQLEGPFTSVNRSKETRKRSILKINTDK